MKKTLAAMAVVIAATTGAALAQTMDEGLSMLEIAAQRELSKIGMGDVDPMSLTLNQLAEIKTITASSDYSVDDKERQIRAILANN
jgi:hypothetical protein